MCANSYVLAHNQCQEIIFDMPESSSYINQDQAVVYLLQRTNRREADGPERAAATELAQEMKGLLPALEQATAYIRTTQSEFRSFVVDYRQRLLGLRGAYGNEGAEMIVAALALSLDAVYRDTRAAGDLLHVLVFLNPNRVPEEWAVLGASKIGDDFAAAFSEGAALEPILGLLAGHSLIRRDLKQRTYDVDLFTRSIIQNDFDESTRRNYMIRAIFATDAAFAAGHEDPATLERLLPQALHCAELIATGQFSFLNAARLLHDTAHTLYLKEEYTESESLYLRALAMAEQLLGPNHTHIATILNAIAVLYDVQRRCEEAEAMYLRALEIYETSCDPDDPQIAIALSNLAEFCASHRRYEEAQALKGRALAIYERSLGPDHPTTIFMRESIQYCRPNPA
ncbi:MAG: hypothetical protein JWQ02_266 [Capsulimonas sp.]|nr:hypothetical protein [Capsulimonas sp.]